MKILLYCHHSIGLGHLMRTLRLAESFSGHDAVAVICGGEVPEKLAVPHGVELHCLAPLSINASGKLCDPLGSETAQRLLQIRADDAAEFARGFKPDVLVVEMYPLGRKKFGTEVQALIDAARHISGAKVVCSVRDILVTTRADQLDFDRNAVDVLNNDFDVLLVHADPNFVDFAESLSTYAAIRIPVHYTGYIAPGGIQPNTHCDLGIVVSAGGGRVGHRLIEVAHQAFPLMKSELGLEMLIVTGSLGASKELPATDQEGLSVVDFVNELPALLARAQLSISQCGYNTTADILAAQTAAVFVPYETPEENEQVRRAQCFAAQGRSVTLRESELTAESMLAAARIALSQSRRCTFAINGVARSKKIISALAGHG
jgi:predicted glycosyltransferase